MRKSNPNSFILKKIFKPFLSSSTTTDQNELELQKLAAQEHKDFPFEVLAAATNNFHPTRKLGHGGFGPVFKGLLKDGREVAVKRLSPRSGQGKTEFQNEVKLLSRVQHKNVVNFVGYCVHESERLLVYEYVANESLDKLLFTESNKREVLDWKRRHGVIAGVAKGLHYLHEQAHCAIIHRDIKASNILLDEKWVPKIADFGMARLFPEDQTHWNTRAVGTNGYMAPEYLFHGILSKKADVFSFGVVVLELISGQKNTAFNRDPDSHSLLEWAYKLYKNQRSLEILDPSLASSSSSSSSADCDEIKMYVQIGLLCVQSDPQLRPDMDRVVLTLSRKPSNLEEPIRPGYPGVRYRKSNRSAATLSTGTSERSNSGSFGSTHSHTVHTSSFTASGLDPHGKRPVKD